MHVTIRIRAGLPRQAVRHRFHARAMKRPLDVRNGLVYVINDFRKHARQAGRTIAARWVDPCSSGPCFDGWRERDDLRAGTTGELGILPARTGSLKTGWRRRGLLAIDEVPGGAPPRIAIPAT